MTYLSPPFLLGTKSDLRSDPEAGRSARAESVRVPSFLRVLLARFA
jgi:hypothetical protein